MSHYILVSRTLFCFVLLGAQNMCNTDRRSCSCTQVKASATVRWFSFLVTTAWTSSRMNQNWINKTWCAPVWGLLLMWDGLPAAFLSKSVSADAVSEINQNMIWMIMATWKKIHQILQSQEKKKRKRILNSAQHQTVRNCLYVCIFKNTIVWYVLV